MVGTRVRVAVGARGLAVLALLTLAACATDRAAPDASRASAPTGTTLAPAGTAAPGPIARGTTAPSTAPGPPQPWGEGGPTVVQFANLGFPSYTIGSPSADPDGRVWFRAGTVNESCLVSVDPASTELHATVEPLGDVATGDDGSVWFTTERGAVRQDADGARVSYDVGAPIGSEHVARPISIDPQGRAWVTATEANAIARIEPHGSVTRFTDGIPAGASPGTIDAGPDGSLWFAEPDVHQVGRASPDGAIEQVAVGGAPEVVVADLTGGAWFFDGASSGFGHIDRSGGVTRVANATPNAPVIDMAVAPDGSVWYVADPGIVGRFGDGLPLQELPIPDEGGRTARASFQHPRGITSDANGTIWFTSYFYGGEGMAISLDAVATADTAAGWPEDLPLDRPIGASITTCGDR
jgi:virginiamycin B lyase